MSECRCSRLKVGSTLTDARNWNADCPEHGIWSNWYHSPEQVARRDAENKRLRDLRAQAALARQRARENQGTTEGTITTDDEK